MASLPQHAAAPLKTAASLSSGRPNSAAFFLSSLPFIGDNQVGANLKRKSDSSGLPRVQFGLQALNRIHVGRFPHSQTTYGTNISAIPSQFVRHNSGSRQNSAKGANRDPFCAFIDSE
jgi:hypothetical protein